MSASYKEVNYSLRPAKHVERKMLAEAFQRLSVFGRIATYRYIGFGSIYFSDFILFHRTLGIDNMLSIEKDTNNKNRFEFNRPFGCVKLQFGKSHEILPTLKWTAKTILWLDYDGQLNTQCLADVDVFCSKASAGSILVISVNSDFDKTEDQAFEKFEQLVGKENMPIGITLKDMRGNGAATVIRNIIVNHIERTLNSRNGVLTKQSKINFTQLFNFQYSDNAKMLTIGGVIWKNSQKAIMDANVWSDLPFVRSFETPYVIEAPCLTLREIRYMDTHLPIGTERAKKKSLIPKEEHDQYSKIYRYYPVFMALDGG